MVSGGEAGWAQLELPLSPMPDSPGGIARQDTARAVVKRVLDDAYSELELVARMGDDSTVVNCARVSYGKRVVGDLADSDRRLIRYLAEHGHTSPFRHVQLQFRIKAPEFVARQWYKHAVGGGFTDTPWNEISQRYVEVPQEFYAPKVWRAQKGKQTSEGIIKEGPAASWWFEGAVADARRAYSVLLQAGVSREQARMVLPLCIYTEWIWTASLQAVAHFVKLRDDEHAQEEIRAYAAVVYNLTERVAPLSIQALLGRTPCGSSESSSVG